jgi:mRNA interferase MazF
VLTRDPVADRIGTVVVAAITRTFRGLVSELELTATNDGVPTDCVVNFDNIHTIPRDAFRRHVVTLEPRRLGQACQRLRDATGC